MALSHEKTKKNYLLLLYILGLTTEFHINSSVGEQILATRWTNSQIYKPKCEIFYEYIFNCKD